MLINYFKIALRNILKQKVYSFINITGLAIGLAACLLIFFHVEYEYSYDQFHAKKDKIYKMFLERTYPDHVTHYAVVPHSFSSVIVQDYDEVKNAVRLLSNPNEVVVRYIDENNEEKAFEEPNFILADSTFFEIFSINLIKGDPYRVLSKAQDVVITEDIALKYFGEKDPIGKVFQSDFGEFTVTGVCENVPKNSHIKFDFVASLETFQFFQTENYTGFSAHIYLELEDEAEVINLESKFPDMVRRYAAPQIEANLNTTFEDYTAAGNGYNYTLVPITEIHLDPQPYELALKKGSNKNDLYILMSIALLILIIACINFMNLSIARSAERSKEVGVRKTLGSLRKQLIIQFLTESVLISLSALIIGLVLMYIALPYYNTLAGVEIPFNPTGWVFSGMLMFALFVGILAGSYPAFFLSGFNAVTVLKGGFKKGEKGAWIRNGLVIFQFAISIILIVGTLIVQDQMEFIHKKDLGFKKNNILLVERAGALGEQLESFQNEVRNIPGVKLTASSTIVPIGQYFGIQFTPKGANEALTVNGMIVDDDFINTLEMEIIQGHGFSKDFNDTLSIVINEQTAALLNTENPIGMKILNTNGNPPVSREYEIIGVVKNFNYQSLKDVITPFVLLNNESGFGGIGYVSINITGDIREVIEKTEILWNKMADNQPFKYSFLDAELNQLYTSEADSSKRLTVFTLLAITIACIGLFGLSAYTVGLRTKEIGVRKVMGASVMKLFLLLSKDFLKLVVFAFILAAPVAWYLMDQWLEGFAYKTVIQWYQFILAGIISISIAWITVSYQAFKASIVNPIKSLRSE
ncbi:MAG: ABC transporter permease [Cyclobacteriaceae bacterium]|nr:ABC transporter permease [Cyclobacteriaceae bacterium]